MGSAAPVLIAWISAAGSAASGAPAGSPTGAWEAASLILIPGLCLPLSVLGVGLTFGFTGELVNLCQIHGVVVGFVLSPRVCVIGVVAVIAISLQRLRYGYRRCHHFSEHPLRLR